MSDNVEIKKDDIKEERSCRISPFRDDFDLFYNCIFNPENPINDGENELLNGLNASKTQEEYLSSKSDSVQKIRTTDKICMEKKDN